MRISELSHRVGVAPDTLRVWERRYRVLQPRRTPGNARLYSAVDEARVRLMQRYMGEGMPAAQAAELAMAARLTIRTGRGPQLEGSERKRTVEAMRDALDAFDESTADQALQQLLGEYSATAVLRDVVIPYLYEVGERWAANHMTIAQEHFASNFWHSRLLALARGWDRGLGPRALLACGPSEQHTLALIAFGIALHAHGWRIVYLGAATPIELLDDTAMGLQPELITVTASVTGRLDLEIERLRMVAAGWPLALAGPAVDAPLARRCNAVHLAQDPVTAAASIAAAPDFAKARPERAAQLAS